MQSSQDEWEGMKEAGYRMCYKTDELLSPDETDRCNDCIHRCICIKM